MRSDIALPFSIVKIIYFYAVQTPNSLHGADFVKADRQSIASDPPFATLASKPCLTLCPPYVGLQTQFLCFQGPAKHKAQQSKATQVCVSKMLGQEAGDVVLQHDYCHPTAHSPGDGHTIPTDMRG